MPEAIKEPIAKETISPDEDVIRSIRWGADEWRLLGDAARLLGEREHLSLSQVDIIKSGALRRAEEILATE